MGHKAFVRNQGTATVLETKTVVWLKSPWTNAGLHRHISSGVKIFFVVWKWENDEFYLGDWGGYWEARKELSCCSSTCYKGVIRLIRVTCGKNLEVNENTEARAQETATPSRACWPAFASGRRQFENLEFSFMGRNWNLIFWYYTGRQLVSSTTQNKWADSFLDSTRVL